jgi:hypothetical protein
MSHSECCVGQEGQQDHGNRDQLLVSKHQAEQVERYRQSGEHRGLPAPCHSAINSF